MTHLSEDTFEHFLSRLLEGGPADLAGITFIDPYAMVGLLEAGRYFHSRREVRPLVLPADGDVLRYLDRMHFFRFAGQYYHLPHGMPDTTGRSQGSADSDVLLEITPIERSDDIHLIVGRVRKRAHTILERHLHYDERAIHGFIVALSEVCQNIVEHSGSTGFVGIQKYHFQNMRSNVVKIAVMDIGKGFRGTISERIPVRDDLDAIEKALLLGVSRHDDPGRGHGLAAVRRFVLQWNGKIAIRSGSSRLSIIPSWSRGRQRESGLAFFPGAQISILLPELRRNGAAAP